MSETVIDVTPDSTPEPELELPNTTFAVVGGALLGVAAFVTVGVVINKFQAWKLKKSDERFNQSQTENPDN